MTASSADTAELPRVPGLVLSPPVAPAPPAPAPPAPPPATTPSPTGRAALRAERLQARRRRRLWACAGLSVLAVMFGITVAVLSVLH
jgi:hypothetical protein